MARFCHVTIEVSDELKPEDFAFRGLGDWYATLLYYSDDSLTLLLHHFFHLGLVDSQ